jgi:hypothetical protein
VKRAVMRRLPFAFCISCTLHPAFAGDGNFRSANSRSKRTIRPIPARDCRRPIKSDYGHKGVWTGKEMIIWGGSRLRGDSLRSYFVRTGGAYDPKTDSWRKVPTAPVPGGSGYSSIWTGDEMILWGDPRRGRRSAGNIGAAYDPATIEWRGIAP